MDFERFERLKELVSDEEQQFIIGLNYELKELERKEKVEDAEYENMLEEVRKTNDEEQLEQFLRDHISISEYNRKRNDNLSIIDEIEKSYGINSQERRNEELHVKSITARQQLTRLKNYYERTGSYVMRNVDVDSLSDEEAVTMWRSFEQSIDIEDLKRMLNSDIKSRMGDPIIEGGTGGDTSETEKEKEKKEKTVEEQIETFKKHAEKILETINKIKNTFVLSSELNIDVNKELKSLTTEIGNLSKEADDLVSEIESLKDVLNAETLSMDIKEIKSMMKNIKNRLKELKQHHIDLYNARVVSTNNLIDELLANEKMTDEIRARLESLRISTLDVNIGDWRTNKYLDGIDFNIFVNVYLELDKIKKELGITEDKDEDKDTDTDLETDMVYIENEITRLEEFPVDDLSTDELNALKENCVSVANRINDFRVKLENNKDNITEKEYNDYLDRINDAEANLAAANSRFKGKTTPTGPTNPEYQQLKEKLEKLKIEVDYCNATIEALYGHLLRSSVSILEERLNTFDGTLEDIKNEIEEKYAQGLLDDNQYKVLNEKVAELEETLKLAHDKVKNPGMFKDIDIFAYLNGRIDGVEAAIAALETQVAGLKKPIKDRKTRKAIDQAIKKIEQEIKSIEKHLEENKEQDPARYEELKGKLDKLKDRMNKLGVDYRKKCPLIVRAVKSAKNFFQRHKKAILIAAGLAALALVGYHVLIPAIMHGNIMIGAQVPALRGFIGFSNNVLGGIIGATKDVNGIWALANGATINPAVASTSLLKGLATSGISSALLITPVVIGVKKLVDKMKKTELKEKLDEKVQKGKEKIAKLNPIKGKKDKNKQADKLSLDEIGKMLKDYRKSGLTLEEFAEENELSEEEINMLRYLEARSNEKKQEQENENTSGRKGR